MIECVPTARLLVLKVATPEESAMSEPIVVVLSRKFTVPVGVPAPGETAATVAVNATDVPDVLVLGLETRVVVVLAWSTTWETALEVLVAKFVSPE